MLEIIHNFLFCEKYGENRGLTLISEDGRKLIIRIIILRLLKIRREIPH